MSPKYCLPCFWLMLGLVLTQPVSAQTGLPDMATLAKGIWIDRDAVASLMTGGPGWLVLEKYANLPMKTPNLADPSQDDPASILTFARALYYARTKDETYRQQVVDACMAAIGTEQGGTTFELGRKLISYVLAADLVQLPPKADLAFRAWLQRVLDEEMTDERSLRETHEIRPNNWGTLAGASRVAVAAYLGDAEEVARVAQIFRGWLGDRDSYAGFNYNKVDWWQANPDKPVGINPVGSIKEGYSIDGVLPEEMRRSGEFSWPPPKENYVYTALQGAVATAVILERAGYNAFNWEDQALYRAALWLNVEANYPAEGDDTWIPYVLNPVYGASFFLVVGDDRAGKNVGFTEWTKASERYVPLQRIWHQVVPSL